VIAATNVTWLAARATGVVAWGLVVTSMVWGLLLATRALRGRATPAALLSMHRFLGALAVTFTAAHVVAILADTFVDFSVVDVLLPLASSWRPVPVALGIIGMYALVVVEVTSLVRSRLSATIWREIHLLSYVLFALVTIHAITAGSDTRATLTEGLAFAVGALAAFTGFGLWWNRSGAAEARAAAAYDR
jgi:DMSO/TMAO reductase YedYZ heme-binding membrane subunit